MLEREIDQILRNRKGRVECNGETIYAELSLQDSIVENLRKIRKRRRSRFEILRKDNIAYVLSDIEAKRDEIVHRIGNQLIDIFATGMNIEKYRIPEGLDQTGGFWISKDEFIERGVETPYHPRGGDILSAMCHIDCHISNVFYFWNIGKVKKDVCSIDIYRGYLSDKFRKYYDKY